MRRSRLVTLTGVGGVGKTRLALQAAAEVLPQFADGVWVSELAAAANGDDMVQVVALALGVVQRQLMTLAESIADFLRTSRTLVLLDNCEHLLDAVTELVEGVLAGAPGVRILATSREGFGIPGERVLPVRSLSIGLERAESSDAVVLFAERARAVAPGFALNERTSPAVIELCRRLDGIPLAIELAAARVATMSPADIVAHLDERFRLLTGGRRGRVERHQTLRAAVEWSYSLLDEAERTVFDRLGVFPSSFDESAAIAVCATDGVERWDVIDALASLVAKSMVGSEPTGDTVRYQLLETLRHFARDRAGDLDGLRRQHARHYAAFAEAAAAGPTARVPHTQHARRCITRLAPGASPTWPIRWKLPPWCSPRWLRGSRRRPPSTPPVTVPCSATSPRPIRRSTKPGSTPPANASRPALGPEAFAAANNAVQP